MNLLELIAACPNATICRIPAPTEPTAKPPETGCDAAKRLEELRDERQNLIETRDDLGDDTSAGKHTKDYRDAVQAVKDWEKENAEELAEMENAAGE